MRKTHSHITVADLIELLKALDQAAPVCMNILEAIVVTVDAKGVAQVHASDRSAMVSFNLPTQRN